MEKICVRDIIDVVSGEVKSGNIESKYIMSVATDSREKMNNGLFIAIKGEKTDGHMYIDKAVENGAICLFITDDQKEYINDVVYIKVDDAVSALKKLATWYRLKFNIPIIAVTGSVGKTTTKDMIACVLGQKYNTLKTKGNLNSDIGAPITVLNLSKSHEIAVIEMGMDNFGQISSISRVVKPETAVITNIGVAHIEFLKTRENILKAKCEVFENLKKDGVAILNSDDDMLITINNDFKKIWYGTNDDANIKAEEIYIDYFNGFVNANVIYNNDSFLIKIPGLSYHLIYSALAAIAIGVRYGLSQKEIVEGLKKYEPTKMRMELHKLKNNILLINDSYNANPQSMKSLIDTICESSIQNKMVILGDMFELGDKSYELHKDVIGYALNKGINNIVILGEAMLRVYNNNFIKNSNIKFYESKEKLYDDLDKILIPNSIIGVKASRSMKFENITEKILEKDNSL